MLNLIIVSDCDDPRIGSNCQLSYDYLRSQLNIDEENLHLLTGEDCISDNVHTSIASFNEKTFILIAYSHGREDALYSTYDNEGYVNTRTAYYYGTSLVYTNSCFTARELQQALIDNECAGYVGYTGIVKLPRSKEDEIIFISCENKGLLHFLTTGQSLTESVNVMRDYYLEQRDNYRRQRMFVTASLLEGNLNLLTHYERNTITRTNFDH